MSFGNLTAEGTEDAKEFVDLSDQMHRRSLSGHYDGKSKSFVQLSEMESGDASDLGKEEHEVNKRRRLLIANQMRIEELDRGNSSAVAQPAPLPELPAANAQGVKDDDDVEAGEGDDVKQQEGDGIRTKSSTPFFVSLFAEAEDEHRSMDYSL